MSEGVEQWSRHHARLAAVWGGVTGRLRSVDARHWQRLLSALAIAWMVAALFQAVVLFWPATRVAPPSDEGGASMSIPARQAAVDIDTMVAWKLFGDAGESLPKSSPADDMEASATPTRLAYTLQGVMLASEPMRAAAIILAEGRQQRYTLGDEVPAGGSVKLAKVLADRVILNNDGRYETLWLYDPNAAPRRYQPPVNSTPAVVEADAAAALDSAQLSLADIMQLSVVRRDGQQIGYRVRPGNNQDKFEALGFRTGDIVTAVNGVALDDPQRALELYNVLRSTQEATLSLRRNDEELSLVVSLAER